ncbi:hypothetical protein COO60DRAFT_1504395 [Scenedesmus sp. NREL 46B-D3]|nr:hypothetical protein COO60DRAFT_1504395 [Scenedesmus sp. NREL 46B-D3]
MPEGHPKAVLLVAPIMKAAAGELQSCLQPPRSSVSNHQRHKDSASNRAHKECQREFLGARAARHAAHTHTIRAPAVLQPTPTTSQHLHQEATGSVPNSAATRWACDRHPQASTAARHQPHAGSTSKHQQAQGNGAALPCLQTATCRLLTSSPC